MHVDEMAISFSAVNIIVTVDKPYSMYIFILIKVYMEKNLSIYLAKLIKGALLISKVNFYIFLPPPPTAAPPGATPNKSYSGNYLFFL